MTTTQQATRGPSGVEIVEALAPLLARQRQRWAARCQAHGLSIIGFHVLALLEEHGSLPMSRVADELDVALPNATGIIGRMAERGLVQRSPHRTDRRVVLVSLTDDGSRLIADMEAERRERMLQLIALLDEPQRRRLLHSVRDLHAAAQQGSTTEEPSP